MSPHPLTDFEIQRYYQMEARFHSVYSRNNLPVVQTPTAKIKDAINIINFDEYKSIETHRMTLYVYGDILTCFDITYFDITYFDVK